MKKRILSMLLLVVMLVTALPLTVLPSLAAEKEEKTYEEADYNALYVLSGMVAGVDFYSTNQYWGGKAQSVTNTNTEKDVVVAAAKTLLDSYRYPGSATFSSVKIPKNSTLTVANGYVDLTGMAGEFQFSNVEALMGYGVNGSAAELVRMVGSKATVTIPSINSLRVHVDAVTGKVTQIQNSSHTMYKDAAAVKAANKLGTDFVYNSFNGVIHTYTTNMQRDELTTLHPETLLTAFHKANPGKIPLYYTSATTTTPTYMYGNADVYAATTDADGKVTVDLGNAVYTLEKNGSGVSATTVMGNAVSSILLLSTRDYPSMPVIPDYVKDAEGNVTENTKKEVYWIPTGERYVDGAFTVYQDGTKLYDNDTAKFVNNAFYKGSDSFIVLWGRDAATVGASGRFYAARYYNRYLTEAEIAQNHFADIIKWFKIDLAVLESVTEADYATIAPAFANFTFESDKAAVEATLFAEVEKVVTNKYAGTHAEAYATIATMYQLDLSFLVDNAIGNLPNTYKFLNGGYKASTDVKGDYAKAVAADYAAMWNAIAMGLEDYNTLYAAQDAALISLDFFKTNEIWGEKMELPKPPYEETAYEYDGKVYDFTKEENRLVQTDRRWAVVRSDKVFVYRTKWGTWGTANANYPQTNLVVDNFSQNMPRQTFTHEEALEIAAGAKKNWKAFDYTIVEIPLWTLWRTQNSDGVLDFYSVGGTWGHSNSKDAAVYMTEAEAEAALAKLPKADGYTYDVRVRPIASAPYQQCIQDYAAAMSNLMYSANINDTHTVNFTQNMTTVGEADFHTKDGASNMYSHVRFENGYMVLDPHHSGPYFSVTNVPAAGALYLDTVISGGNKVTANKDGTKVMVLRNKNLMLNVTSGGTTIVSFGGEKIGATVLGNNVPFRLTIDSFGVASTELANGKETTVYDSTFTVGLNGTEVLNIDTPIRTTNQGLIGHSQLSEAQIYTYRIYNRTLTAAEQAQNHFADIAKYFKLNITGYDALDAKGKAAVHAAVADITFANTRAEAQSAINHVLNEAVRSTYAALKAEHPEIPAAFVDLAFEYRLDLSEVIASTADLKPVYALSFEGLSCVAAQALLDETLYDVEVFYPHLREGEDAWSAWVLAVAKANTIENLDAILVLPMSIRREIVTVENNTDATVIAAFVAEKLALYGDGISTMKAEQYNALYVQSGLLMAMDFFGTNSYWQMGYELPLAPSDNTAYWYDLNADGEKTEDEIFDLTNATDRATAITVNGKASTVFAQAKAEWQTAYRNYMNSTFRWTTGSMGIGVFSGSSETQERAPFYLTDGGYAQFHNKYASSGGLIFNGIPTNATTTTAQLVLSLTKFDDSETTNPLLFHNIRPNVTVEKEKVTFTGLSGTSSIGGLYYSKLTIEETKETTVYAEYDSRMMPSRTALATDAEKYAAELTAAATDGATYTAVKISVAKYEIHKNGVKYATLELVNKPNPAYLLKTDPSIEYAYGEVFDLTGAIQLQDGNDYFILRTQDGTVGELTAPYDVSATKLDSSNYYLGWGTVHKHMRVYAFRHYDRIISDAEILQNHFIDLAKFFRIDLTDYLKLDEDGRAAVHTAMKGFDLGTADRADVLAALYEALYTADYAEGDTVLSADLMAIARELDLNVSGLIAAPAARAYAEAVVLADFKAGSNMDRRIIQALIDDAVVYKTGFAFEGMQVRLQANSGDIPGVRALFSVNKSVVDAFAATGRAVDFGVEICTPEGKKLATLCFTADGNGGYSGTNTVAATNKQSKAVIKEVGENTLAFAYTVVFDSEATQTADYYNVEFAYRFFFEVNGLRHNAETVENSVFAESVSAAEAYRYFYENGYAADRVVAAVMAELNGGINEDAILVETAEEAQAALDNAAPGTTIQLAPGVDYGSLSFRANPGHANTTEVEIANAFRYDYVRSIEDITIIGAPGAKVDAFVFETGARPGDWHVTVDVKNLVIDGVEFTDALSASTAGYNAPIFITTSNATVDGLTVKNCKLIGDNSKLNLVYLYGADGSKNVTLSGNTVDGMARLCELRGTENVTITGNVIKNTYEHAMLLAGGGYSGNVTITGNTADGIGNRFVRMAGAGDANVVITDNVITNYLGSDADYIKVTDSTGTPVIENNTLVK